MNAYWKQVSGNFMYNWLKKFYGVQTDMIVEKCLEHLPILEIRMMLLDYERLLFRANEAQQEFHALSFVQGKALSIMKQNQPQQIQAANFEDESGQSVNDTAATDQSFTTEIHNEKEIWENFFNALDEK